MQSLDIGLCRIDIANMELALSEIRKMRSKNTKGYVITPNIDHLARLAESQDSKELENIYYSANLSLCDSRILELMLRRHGHALPGVVAGSDLTARLFDSEIDHNDRVYILGGDENTVEKIRKNYAHINFSHHNPSMGFINKADEVKAIVADIVDHDPNYVFLAVGSPRQEMVASQLVAQKNFHGLAFCIGASIAFLAGAEKRAPLWMQNLRLEWLYRLIQSPSRLGVRYLKNAIKLPLINRKIAENLRQETTA